MGGVSTISGTLANLSGTSPQSGETTNIGKVAIVEDGSAETFGKIFDVEADGGTNAQVGAYGEQGNKSLAENNSNSSSDSTDNKFFGENLRNYQVSELEFSGAAQKHMGESGRTVPIEILKDAIASGYSTSDPRGSSAIMYYTTIYKNGQKYNLEVLYDPNSNKIFHFEYTRRAIGPLPKIKK